MATQDTDASHSDADHADEGKSARREFADGLGSLLRAAKKVVAEVDSGRLEALGLRAIRELDASRLGELGRKAVERVERFDPTAGVAELFSVVEKVADQVESFVRADRHPSSPPSDGRSQAPYGEPPGPAPSSAAQASSSQSATAAEPRADAPAQSATSTTSDDPTGAKWRLRVDD